MDKEFDFEAEFQRFENICKDLNRMSEEIDSDCKALEEAQIEADKIEQLEKQLKENQAGLDEKKIKQEISERTTKIEELLASIK